MDKCNFCLMSNENNVCMIKDNKDRIPCCTTALERMINSAKGAAIYHNLSKNNDELLGERGLHKCTLCKKQFNGYCTIQSESDRHNDCMEALYNLQSFCNQLQDIRM